MKLDSKIVIPGGAGLVGQNLVPLLVDYGYKKIFVIDKNKKNLTILQKLNPSVKIILADLAEESNWIVHFKDAAVVIMLQAQIGGVFYEEFKRNNIDSTNNIISAMKIHRVNNLVHISSSVVKSKAKDFYTRTKKNQEQIVINSGLKAIVLRPTLMFGLFDRKHLGWLSRFMKISIIFPIPGLGKYSRQPLYAYDFCKIILSCIQNKKFDGAYNISGREKIFYIDLIRKIKLASNSKAIILCIPYSFFHLLLRVWGFIDKNPPFTPQQLEALVADDNFEVIDWPNIFAIDYTTLDKAIDKTFKRSFHSEITLDF